MKIHKRFLLLLAALVVAPFFGCNSSIDDDPDAQIPKLTAITGDVATVVNVAKELSVGVEISDAGKLSYQWYEATSKLAAGTAIEHTDSATFTPQTATAGTYYYYCVVTNRLGSSTRTVTSPRITYTVSEWVRAQKPVIADQSASVSLDFGTEFTLSVIAYATDGGTLSYQWYVSATEDGEATALNEATTSHYTATVGTESLGFYHCVVTNMIEDNGDGGEKSAVSKTELIEVSSTQIKAKNPVILQQPQNVKQDFGNTFAFTVAAYSADEGTLSYQWYYKATEESAATILNGATDATYAKTVSSGTIGYYFCEVTNMIADNGDGGAKTATVRTNTAKLSNDTIDANEPVILTQPEDAELSVPQKISFSISAYTTDGGTLSYQWYTIAGNTETAISGATNATYEVAATEVGLTQYYCLVTNSIADNGDGGTKNARTKSNVATVTVVRVDVKEPVITMQPDDAFAVIPAIKTFTVSAYTEDGGMLAYQWYAVADGESEGTAIADAKEAKLVVTARELGKTGYYCVITNTIADNGDGGTKSVSVQSDTAWFDAVYLKDAISPPEFTTQPTKLNIAPRDTSITISCVAESAEGKVSYCWYESGDGTTENGTAIPAATSATFTTPVYTEKGIYYYYCVATTVFPASDSDTIESAVTMSDVVSVAYTGLPTVYINTPKSVAITSKTEWTKDATISVQGAEDSSWNFDAVTTSIRGRGNSTWGQPKKPYALKLDKKREIFGLPKHKRWVLIANYLDNSFMRNEMAFYLSEQFGLDWTVHGDFVDLVLNGEYKGLYWLGEAIKVDENRVNINDGSKTMTDDEDKDYLIEMDVYYDEIVKFKSPIRNMPYMIKNDDYMIDDSDTITSGGEARLERLQEKITALENLLYPDFTNGMNTNNCSAPDESYSTVLDIDSWAKFWFVNEIMDNGELGHPKSCYFSFDSTKNIFKAGPVWDFDWASLYQRTETRLKNTIYYNALFKSPAFTTRVKELWSESYAKIDISSQIETMRNQLAVAAKYDMLLWGAHWNPDEKIHTDFAEDVDFLKDTLEKKFAVVQADVNGL